MLQKLLRMGFAQAMQPINPASIDKQVTKNLLEKLQKQSFTLSRDGYKVQVGLIIERRPIFIKANETEMQLKRLRYQIKKKYNLYPTLPKDLFDFATRDPINRSNEIPTHMKENEKGEKVYYFSRSKFFRNVDPNCQNKSSIQYMPCYHTYMMFKQGEQWAFPTAVVQDRQSFVEAREILFKDISGGKWRVIPKKQAQVDLKSHYPLVVRREEQPQDERVKGIKTFYYVVNHIDGEISTHGSWNTTMEWVPRGHFNKYVDRDFYYNFVGIMSP